MEEKDDKKESTGNGEGDASDEPKQEQSQDSNKEQVEGIEKLDLSPDLDISKNFEEKTQEAEPKQEEKPEPTPEQKESSIKSNKNFALIVLVIVIGGGGLFVYNYVGGGGTNTDDVVYNGYPFVKIDTHWYTQWQSEDDVFNLRLRFNPYEAENVPILGELNDDFSLVTSYITFDPDLEANSYGYEALAAAELTLNLAGVFGTNLVAACTKNISGECSVRPTITCENTEDQVLYLKRSDKAEVLLEGNCITIAGKDLEIVKAADKLLYKIYGIIE